MLPLRASGGQGAVTGAEGYRSLVSMERMPDGGGSEESTDKKGARVENSWLMEFLLEGGARQYNPFEPTEKIQIKMGDQKEGRKKYH